MGRLNGGSSSEVPTDPQTSEHDIGQPGPSSSAAAPGTQCGLFNALGIHFCVIKGTL